MRVLQIGDEWPSDRPGGLNSYFSSLINEQAELGVNNVGLVVGGPRVVLESNGLIVPFANAEENLLRRLFQLRESVQTISREGNIDLFAVHFALYGFPILHRLRKSPTVVHFHGPWAAEAGAEGSRGLVSLTKRAMEQLVYKTANRFVVLSDAFRNELQKSYGISDNRIALVPGGVDVNRFSAVLTRKEARTRLGWHNDTMVFVSVRRHVRRMGLENLLDAAKLLRDQGLDFMLYLGGSGPISQELSLRIKESGLDQQVIMLGRVSSEDLPLVYRAADLSIVPSQSLEGFGLIAVESLASGTPVYVTPVGGLPEIIQPFAPQCIFENFDTRAIAAGLHDAISGRHTIPSDESCREYAVSRYSWPLIARQVTAVYKDVAK